MFLADRHIERLLGYVWVVPCAAIVVVIILCGRALDLPAAELRAEQAREIRLKWAGAGVAGDVDWSILRKGDGAAPSGTGSLAQLFRLAGTFFAYTEGTKDQRKAVLDNLKTGKQTIVEERTIVEGVTVLKIYHDRVVLRGDSGEEELWLGFSGRAAGRVATEDTPGKVEPPAGAASSFGGKQIGRNSWVFQRKPLLEYYNELRQEPSRLYAVFDSMKPIYGEGNQIFGYQLQIEGEEEFWAAAGLKEGDIVRKVNSMVMSNRRRAERFIGQFIKNEANVFLLDIERDGDPVRLSYRTR